MERFEGLLARIFAAGRKKPKAQEADAEEVMEGGVPPSEGGSDE